MKPEDIRKYLSAKGYEELESYFPQGIDLGTTPLDIPIEDRARIPSDVIALIAARRGIPKERTREQLYAIARQELAKSGVKNVAFRVSREGHEMLPADATIRESQIEGKFLVTLHPSLLWGDEAYVRDVIQHELLHILE